MYMIFSKCMIALSVVILTYLALFSSSSNDIFKIAIVGVLLLFLDLISIMIESLE